MPSRRRRPGRPAGATGPTERRPTWRTPGGASQGARDLRKFGTEGMLRDLLPVADNLERARRRGDEPRTSPSRGVQLVLRQFISKVEQYGARPFDIAGRGVRPAPARGHVRGW
ncbi:MAG: nucleotide exchange factor GrpE [bacterium]